MTVSTMTAPAGDLPFDGVVCFGGEDWWYHNRAHYDMQMMRELSAHVPVLYVNSIGMRVPTPSEGGMFLRRVKRKLGSFAKGLVRVRERFAVMSPIVVPGRVGMAVSGRLLPHQVSRAARRLGMRRPLVWVACPPGIAAARVMERAGLVYQRTDRFEKYEGVDEALIRGFHEELARDADVVLYCSRHLFDAESDELQSAAFIDHGVDFDDFARAGDDPAARAGTGVVEGLPTPRIGFVGDIDSAVFDADLLLDVARLMPDVAFVLVGGCTLDEGWADACPNVHLTGRVPYEEVAGTMAGMDVLMMPWHRSEWIEACNPIKLKEYLAVGRPVVSTDFPELRHYEGLVAIANDAPGFAAAIRGALDAGDQALIERGRERIAGATWTARADAVIDLLRSRL